jgi:hypothetical protein
MDDNGNFDDHSADSGVGSKGAYLVLPVLIISAVLMAFVWKYVVQKVKVLLRVGIQSSRAD